VNLKTPQDFRGKRILIGIVGLSLATLAWATPPLGFIFNQILVKGLSTRNIHQHAEVRDLGGGLGKDQSEPGDAAGWEAEVHTRGETDFYIQHLVLAPGGYSGWHSHPGILIGTVVSGTIDLYSERCEKQTIGAGQMYFENTRPHGIINNGPVNAELKIAYLIRHDAPRRLEAEPPACATTTGIP
jgi:quercetin dioxygenase-like cupin family protein